jgi:hypothetical protein
MIEQSSSFFSAKRTRFADGKSPESQRAHPRSNQPADGKAEDQQAASNLSLSAFDKGQ